MFWFLFDREMLRIWQKSSNNACLFFDVSICWFLLPRHSSTSDALSFCRSKIFGLDPKFEKSLLWVSIFRCVDLLVFVVPPFKYTQLMPCPFVEPKLFWVSPKFFGWTQNLEKSPQCVSFLVQSKNIWTREKVQIFFGPIEGWGMNDWCLSIGGKHEWSWVGFNTMVKINKILCMNSPI